MLFRSLGVIWAGGVAVGVNPRVPASDWLAILDAAGFAFILAEAATDTPAPWSRLVVSLDAWRQELAAAAPGVKLYRIYRERIAQFRASPPAADWDGIFGYTAR